MNTNTGNSFGVFAGLYFLAFQATSIVGLLLSGALIELTSSQRAMLLAAIALRRVSDRDFENVGAVLAAD